MYYKIESENKVRFVESKSRMNAIRWAAKHFKEAYIWEVNKDKEMLEEPAGMLVGGPATKEEVKERMEKNDFYLFQALRLVYSYQTAEEKDGEHTGELNGVGFNRYDSEKLTRLAKQLDEYGELTPKQIDTARHKMKKYAGQILKLKSA